MDNNNIIIKRDIVVTQPVIGGMRCDGRARREPEVGSRTIIIGRRDRPVLPCGKTVGGAPAAGNSSCYSRCARVRRLPPPAAREWHRPAAAGKRSKRRSLVRSVAAAICGSSVVSCFVWCPSSICAADVECPRNDDRMFCNQNTISMEFDSVWSALVLLVCSTNRYRPRHLLVIDIAYYNTKK